MRQSQMGHQQAARTHTEGFGCSCCITNILLIDMKNIYIPFKVNYRALVANMESRSQTFDSYLGPRKPKLSQPDGRGTWKSDLRLWPCVI